GKQAERELLGTNELRVALRVVEGNAEHLDLAPGEDVELVSEAVPFGGAAGGLRLGIEPEEVGLAGELPRADLGSRLVAELPAREGIAGSQHRRDRGPRPRAEKNGEQREHPRLPFRTHLRTHPWLHRASIAFRPSNERTPAHPRRKAHRTTNSRRPWASHGRHHRGILCRSVVPR